MRKPRWVAMFGLTLLVAALASACTSGDSNEQANSGITVIGTGKVSAAPDLALVRLGVHVERPTVEEAREAAAQTQTNVIDSLKASGVESKDVQTSGYRISPMQDFTNGVRTVRGYAVDNTVIVRVRKLDALSKTLDEATRAGGNDIYISQMSFTIDDPEALRSQARALAIEQARKRAEEIADKSGVSLGAAVSIIDDVDTSMYPRSGQGIAPPVAAPRTGGGETLTPIEMGELDVTLIVQVIYKID